MKDCIIYSLVASASQAKHYTPEHEYATNTQQWFNLTTDTTPMQEWLPL
jgi:hypothetical protein